MKYSYDIGQQPHERIRHRHTVLYTIVVAGIIVSVIFHEIKEIDHPPINREHIHEDFSNSVLRFNPGAAAAGTTISGDFIRI